VDVTGERGALAAIDGFRDAALLSESVQRHGGKRKYH
jgi:hypothetical protein